MAFTLEEKVVGQPLSITEERLKEYSFDLVKKVAITYFVVATAVDIGLFMLYHWWAGRR